MNRKQWRITPEFIVDLLKDPNTTEGFRIRAEGVPDDLKIVGSEWKTNGPWLILVVESKTFRPDGEDDFKPIFHKELIESEPKPQAESALTQLKKAHPSFFESLGFVYSEE